MAGTIPNLPLSTQFDKDTGAPLRGGRLFFFQAGTIATPQLAFKDTGLTQPHPNPVTLDGAGRIPSFYLADGSIHVRLANAQGVTQFEELNLLVVGPSSGGGGGGSVDATAIFQTGDVVWLDQAGTRAGWVRDNGRTIGSAVSGASERANADCQNLYTFLWNTYSNAVCPVNGGRGASAAADWTANKWITLPDKRGYAPGGLDDMGNAAANRFTGVPVISGTVTTAGAQIGETTHTLATGELPAHKHPAFIKDDGHAHAQQRQTNTGGGQIISIGAASTGGAVETCATMTATATTGVRVKDAAGTLDTTDNAGGGGAHNVTQRTVLGTFYRKL